MATSWRLLEIGRQRSGWKSARCLPIFQKDGRARRTSRWQAKPSPGAKRRWLNPCAQRLAAARPSAARGGLGDEADGRAAGTGPRGTLHGQPEDPQRPACGSELRRPSGVHAWPALRRHVQAGGRAGVASLIQAWRSSPKSARRMGRLRRFVGCLAPSGCRTCTSWLGVAAFPSSVWPNTPDMRASPTQN